MLNCRVSAASCGCWSGNQSQRIGAFRKAAFLELVADAPDHDRGWIPMWGWKAKGHIGKAKGRILQERRGCV